MRSAFSIAREVRDWVTRNDQRSLNHYKTYGTYPKIHTEGTLFSYHDGTKILVFSGEPPKPPLITAIGPHKRSVFISQRRSNWPKRLFWFLLKEEVRYWIKHPRKFFRKSKREFSSTLSLNDLKVKYPDLIFEDEDSYSYRGGRIYFTQIRSPKGFILDRYSSEKESN